MSSAGHPDGTSVAVGAFAHASRARQAAQALRRIGIRESEIKLFVPDTAQTSAAPARNGGLNSLDALLGRLGVSEGELRFYADQLASGRALLVVALPTHDHTTARELILQLGGYDVQSRGAELARPAGAGI